MVRYIEWLSTDDRITDSEYMIKTINNLNPHSNSLSIPDVEYNPCNIRLIAVAIKDILLLNIDDMSLTDMINNIDVIINDDEFNYIYSEVKHVYSFELYHILKVFKIYTK